jgi:DNA-binding transcriptional MerR regulator
VTARKETLVDWSIQEIARLAGTTSRTLRHYDETGLLTPSRVGTNGYRYYDQDALARLQRILLLRDLGLGLPAIADVLAGQTEHADALLIHLHWLQKEKDRLDRQIGAVEKTIRKLDTRKPLMAEEMFDGFDHTKYKSEVEDRWGKEAYAASDHWWRSQSLQEKGEWKQIFDELAAGIAAATSGIGPDSDAAQTIAQRHFDWLRRIPGTPGGGAAGPTKEYFTGLGEMYVADPRFAVNYGGQEGAKFVRDAMAIFAERNL